MKKNLILLFSIISITATAQNISKSVDSMRNQLKKDIALYDSAKRISESLMVINNKRFDSLEMARQMKQNEHNLDGLLKTMKERDAKAKKGMWLRIGFGIAMLVVLVTGLMRKRKKKIL